ncbi:MAG: OadG family protein [bacterium]|nr:OadG family protein [bacterium]
MEEMIMETVAPVATAAPSIAEKAVTGLGVAVLGMLTVFAGLVILIAFISLLSKFTGKDNKKKNNTPSGEVKKVEEAPAAPAAAPVEGIPAEVIAAITAALSVVMGEGKFVVRHVKRISNAPAWNRAGREEQVYSRF